MGGGCCCCTNQGAELRHLAVRRLQSCENAAATVSTSSTYKQETTPRRGGGSFPTSLTPAPLHQEDPPNPDGGRILNTKARPENRSRESPVDSHRDLVRSPMLSNKPMNHGSCSFIVSAKRSHRLASHTEVFVHFQEMFWLGFW